MVAPYLPDEVKHTFVNSAPIALEVFDRAAAPCSGAQRARCTTAPSSELAEEIDGAAEWLGVQPEEILLAALGRTFGRTRGEGAVAVDVRTGRQRQSRPVSLLCAASWPMGPSEMLQGAHNALAAASAHHGAPAEIALTIAPVADDDTAGTAALELRVLRIDGMLHLQWAYDAARLDGYSVEEMAEQFPLALIEITSDAGAPL
ncbi:hypothetical protein BST22_03385 [Mycolicibacterium chubuense]|uniref:Phthiocerol synthesis polyketide synthase type I PpsE n=1 Tax=Mycolicibacterium chubuense TaxID=1800 RepID=A0A0J6WE40_MYCCU|nr:hypothetical protein [Mycolicibacterium chubuense]KMO81520.1 Phthiocerol synthesis polyketide synthase type I PpsE [Mycolicibacterium chubuense]ORA55582.1 hypothetical protein BST22_03385 [Mycolicibacterium chubuense]SPX95749.1 beta-ketoacyl synthase [Mycolicibacterium chubuense]